MAANDDDLKDLRDYARKAWDQERVRLLRAIEEVEDAVGDENSDLRQRLDEVGLSGQGLAFKLSGFRRELEELGRLMGALQDRVEWTIVKPLLHRVLKWINIILGSLSRALPVLELKEAVEHSLRD